MFTLKRGDNHATSVVGESVVVPATSLPIQCEIAFRGADCSGSTFRAVGSPRFGRLVTMSGPDVLFPVRNNFYLGAFQRAVNDFHAGKLSDADAVERDCTVYRSYIALGQH